MNDIVNDRLKALGWSAYRLVKELGGRVPERTVYHFVSGASPINSTALRMMFDALGLKVVAVEQQAPKTTKKAMKANGGK